MWYRVISAPSRLDMRVSPSESSVKDMSKEPDEDEFDAPLIIKLVLGVTALSLILTIYMIYFNEILFSSLFFIIFIIMLTIGHFRYGDEINELIDLEEAKAEYKEAKGEVEAEQTTRTRAKSVTRVEHPELEKQVEDKKAEGWSVQEIDNANERVVMIGTEGGTVGGHALTGVLTGLWTFGVGNVVYDKLSKKNNRERIVLRVDENDENTSGDSGTDGDGIELLKELKELNEEGVISDEEFENKKEELLENI